MISVSEARKMIWESISPLTAIRLSLGEAAGGVLAEDVFAARDIPAFPQSSMDGYTFRYNDWKSGNKIFIDGEMAAGTDRSTPLQHGKAMRIFTGAPVPPGADTVVAQEKISINSLNGEADVLIIEDELLQPGIHVRPQGSEIRSGELALSKGGILFPGAIGFLAGIGVSEVLVYPSPTVRIIVTGKELQQPGQPLRYGQVYESNSFTLTAALRQLHLSVVSITRVDDEPQQLETALTHALQHNDLVLLTGGISVGDYDFVLRAANACGVQQVFHKVKQRPGKPLYFGMKNEKPVFGLPGNPSSVLTCFYEYVIPGIARLMNRKMTLQTLKVPLAASFQKAAGLTHFLKGFYDGQTVLILSAQESYRLKSFSIANCLVEIDEEQTVVKAGDIVKVHLLPS